MGTMTHNAMADELLDALGDRLLIFGWANHFYGEFIGGRYAVFYGIQCPKRWRSWKNQKPLWLVDFSLRVPCFICGHGVALGSGGNPMQIPRTLSKDVHFLGLPMSSVLAWV